MRRASIFLAALWLAAGTTAYGQSLLKGLEERLQKATSGLTQGAEAVPGTGYLGAVLDDDEQPGRGVRVKEVRAGGPAELGGLKAGDLIATINSKAITKMDDLDAILNKAVPGQRLVFLVERGGQRQTVNVMLGTRQAAATPPAPAPAEAPAIAPPLLTSPTPGSPTESVPGTPPALSPSATPAAPPPPTPALGGASPPAAAPSLSPAAPSSTLPSLPTPSTIRSRPLDQASPPPEPAAAEPRLGPSTSSPSSSAPSSPAIGGSGGASLGIMVDEMNDESRTAYGLTVRRGALITSVKPDSPADRAGLPVGGLVVAFDGRRIDSADDLVAAIRGARAGQEVELGYYQGDKFNRKSVRLGTTAASSAGGALPTPFGPVSPQRAGPLALGRGPLGPDRPLLGKVERLVDSLAPKPLSTVYNPSEMAALHDSVVKLTEQMRKLEERLNAIENKTSSSPVPPPLP